MFWTRRNRSVIRKGKLTDLRVDRVDGVGEPATGYKWAIIKQENATASSATVAIETIARTAFDAVAKESLSEETIALLKQLAEALGVEAAFKSAEDTKESAEVAADEEGEVERSDDDDAEADAEETVEVENEASDDAEVVDTDEPVEASADADEPVEQHEAADDAPATDAIKEAVKDALAEILREAQGERLPHTAPLLTKSRQPKEQDGSQAVAKGDGLFANVIFGPSNR